MNCTKFVTVIGVMATDVAAAYPAVFQAAITWTESLPVIALDVVKHAPDATARIVKMILLATLNHSYTDRRLIY